MKNDLTLPLEECVICFYPLTDKDIAVTACGHKYHHECIRKWFAKGNNKRCPLCNGEKKIDKVIRKKSQWCCFWF